MLATMPVRVGFIERVSVFAELRVRASTERTTFRDHVRAIVRFRSQKEVVGADARWVVALVTDANASRYLACLIRPGEPMREDDLAARIELTVARTHSRALPFPAPLTD